jgi:hypothetical protein
MESSQELTSDEFGCIPVNVEFLINYDQLSICLHTHTNKAYTNHGLWANSSINLIKYDRSGERILYLFHTTGRGFVPWN